MHILFVCHGNICRSPMAEFVMKDLVRRNGLDWYIESCGVSDEEFGHDMSPSAQRCLSGHGVPYERRHARPLEENDYYIFDKIIVMDHSNLMNAQDIVGGDPEGKISLMMSHCGEQRGVSDPWYTRDYETAYSDIRRACIALLEELS